MKQLIGTSSYIISSGEWSPARLNVCNKNIVNICQTHQCVLNWLDYVINIYWIISAEINKS